MIFCVSFNISVDFFAPVFFIAGRPIPKRPQSCICQKQPFTKTTVLYLGSTISGHPGSFRTFFLYRRPWENRYLRTISSGLVFVLRICDMFLLRTSFECVSAISILNYIIVNSTFRQFYIWNPQFFAAPALISGNLVHGKNNLARKRTSKLPVIW